LNAFALTSAAHAKKTDQRHSDTATQIQKFSGSSLQVRLASSLSWFKLQTNQYYMGDGETDAESLADQWIQDPLIGVRLNLHAPGSPGNVQRPGSPPASPVFVKLHIRPQNPLASVNLTGVVKFSAFGERSNGTLKMMTSGITWQSSNPNAAVISKTGEALGKAAGSTTITAKHADAGLEDRTTLVISQPGKGPVLQSVEIEPSNPTFRDFEPQPFSLIGLFSDGSRHDVTEKFEWASSNPDILSISNSPAGLATPGLESGTVTLTAVDKTTGMGDSTSVTVEALALRKIKISPSPEISIRRGSTEMFAALGTFSDDSTRDVTRKVRWRSSAANLLKITAQGMATGLEPGKVIVTANDPSDPTINDSVKVTVLGLRGITIGPDPSTITSGAPFQFTAQGLYADGSVDDVTGIVTWESSDPDVVKIDRSSGTVISSSPGVTTITAAYPDKSQVVGKKRVTVESGFFSND
jgi:hypothetical protein